jgi:glycosyltransferase involved in cell wall biosynthesis
MSLVATPKISIITSVYNGDKFIEGFLQDITQQTIFDQCELIIINAASPGNEDRIIREYAQRFSNIISIKLRSDPGLYVVWNHALSMARGRYITNANLDDRLAHDCYEIHAAYLDAHAEIDLVHSDNYITTVANETFAEHTGRQWFSAPQASRESMSQCWPCSNPMWRATMHDRYGLFDESYKSSGDWEMWLRALEGGALFKKISGYYLLYYHNPEGLSTGKRNDEKIAEDKKIIARYGYMWGEGNYSRYYILARSLDMAQKDNPQLWPLALNYYLKAYTLKPHRAEPLIRIAQYYVSQGQPAVAYVFATQAAKIACPKSNEELVEIELYDYTRYDILGQVAWYANEFADGEQALNTVIATHPELGHLQRNLEFYLRRK